MLVVGSWMINLKENQGGSSQRSQTNNLCKLAVLFVWCKNQRKDSSQTKFFQLCSIECCGIAIANLEIWVALLLHGSIASPEINKAGQCLKSNNGNGPPMRCKRMTKGPAQLKLSRHSHQHPLPCQSEIQLWPWPWSSSCSSQPASLWLPPENCWNRSSLIVWFCVEGGIVSLLKGDCMFLIIMWFGVVRKGVSSEKYLKIFNSIYI